MGFCYGGRWVGFFGEDYIRGVVGGLYLRILGFCVLSESVSYIICFHNKMVLSLSLLSSNPTFFPSLSSIFSPYSPSSHLFPVLSFQKSYITGEKLLWTILLVILGMVINFAPEKFHKFPLALISIIVVTFTEWVVVRNIYKEGTTVVEDFASLQSDFLSPSWDVTIMPEIDDALQYVG